MSRTFLRGADVIGPDRVAERHTIVLDGNRIADIVSGSPTGSTDDVAVDLDGRIIAPGFIDAHIHGVLGRDVLEGDGAVAAVSAALPRFGVTAFCPTSIACSAATLETFLLEVRRLEDGAGKGARVLGAHLESNFLNPEYRGAQPAEWLREPAVARDILDVIERHAGAIAIATVAPEIEGGLQLIRTLADLGIRVSLGHSAATFEDAERAFALGATRVTHLFNRMPPVTHRSPGLAGAALSNASVAVEVIADGHHVHAAVLKMVVVSKGPSRVIAITDGTAGSGLPEGSRARLGGRTVTVGATATLEDGTLAGSVATMDGVFARLVTDVNCTLVEAARMCATTPADDLGQPAIGRLAPGVIADFVVLTRDLRVTETWIDGRRVFHN